MADAGSRNLVSLADLGQANIGDSELLHQMAHGRLPDALMQFFASDFDRSRALAHFATLARRIHKTTSVLHLRITDETRPSDSL